MKKYNLDITYTSYSAINELGTKLYNVIIKKEMVYENFLKSCDIIELDFQELHNF